MRLHLLMGVATLGYKEKTFSGTCALKPVERWLYVDTTWLSKRWYCYDLHSNYLKPSSLIRIRAHK